MTTESEHPDPADLSARLDRIESGVSALQPLIPLVVKVASFCDQLAGLIAAFSTVRGRAGKVITEVLTEANRNGSAQR